MAMGTLEEESDLARLLRGRIADLSVSVLDEEERSDKHLLRWLRARDLDMSKAEEMIRKSVEWRRANRIDSSLFTFRPPALYHHKFRVSVTGFDDAGCPIVIAPLWDIRPVASRQRPTLTRFVDQIIFQIATICKLRGVTQFVFVSDLDGFEWKHLKSRPALEALLEMVRSFEANYPETLKRAVAINAPKIFTILFNLIKPLLTARTLAKVQICGQNPEVWKRALLETIPANRLPVKYGGSLQEKDIPRILEDKGFLRTGQRLELDLDLDLKEEAEMEGVEGDGDELMTIEIGAGEKFDIELPLRTRNTVLRWCFKTDRSDIGFMVHLRKGTEAVGEIVVPYGRHEETEGVMECSEAGLYVATFDNTFSRFRAKLVTYLIQTLAPHQINLNIPL